MKNPQITIIGSALSGNKGASAMLESAIQTLEARLDNPRFTLLSMYPNEDIAQNTYKNLEIIPARPLQLGVAINSLALAYRILPFTRGFIRARSRAISALVDSSVLLDQGGITFTDGREKFLLYNVASILPALNLGTPVFKCAQAVGPFQGRVNRRVALTFLPRVRTLVTRGRITHEYAERLGLSNLVEGADFAFSLELSGAEESSLSQHVSLDFFDNDVVGVCPSVVLQKKVEAGGGDYIGAVIALIEHIRMSGKRVLLVPHSVRTGTEDTHNNDMPLCRRIHSQLRLGDDLLFIDRELTSQELRYLIGRCSVFVASRFHAMVSSLAMSVPTLVIGWSHKYREVLEMFGLEEWAFGHDKLTSSYVIERFDDLVDREQSVRAAIVSALPLVRQKSIRQADLIANVATG